MTTRYVRFAGLVLVLLTAGSIYAVSRSPRLAPTTPSWQAGPAEPAHAAPASSMSGAPADVLLLGTLAPTPGLLPPGTTSVTLVLSTTVAAECRWSESTGVPYSLMSDMFEKGQGTTAHSTLVIGLQDLGEYWFYVRCQDMAGDRDPDAFERSTHLRVLGAWGGGYPRLAYLWGYTPTISGTPFLAGYDLVMPTELALRDPARQVKTIRSRNPGAKVLLSLDATYGWPGRDPLASAWFSSKPGDPGYNCLLRDGHGEPVLVAYFGHPMYNMTVAYCRDLLVRRNVDTFLSQVSEAGAGLIYDGLFWDLLHEDITWLGDDIDSDLDGRPDDPTVLDAAYQAGLADFLARVRADLPDAILMGNEASQVYAPWLNGRLIEWQLSSILNGSDALTWDDVMAEYHGWEHVGLTPRTTFIMTGPEPLYEEKQPFHSSIQVPPAMQEEAAASYRRMRFGLTSALMGDGLFSYDLRQQDSRLWWYDEFGAPADDTQSSLPPRGYLGQPMAEPRLLVDTLQTPDQIIGGGFENGMDAWKRWVNTAAGAAGTLDIDARGGVSGGSAAHVVTTRTGNQWDVQLSQAGLSTVAGQGYTVSFWARSTVTRTVDVRIAQAGPPGTNYGFNEHTVVTPRWKHFQLAGYPTVTAGDGELAFQAGASLGELWLDDVKIQAGVLGVWFRPYQHGLAIVNTTKNVQYAPLPATYCKLKGSQAPLFQARLDDDEAVVSGSWQQQAANKNQFGPAVQVAPGGSAARITYTPDLASAGIYEVLAWVAPTATQGNAATVTINHQQGQTSRSLDQTTGDIGWHSLGTYTFAAGKTGSATLVATGSGIVVADAFKWVSLARYNDGSVVDSITLQPQDGIVLLSTCYQPAGITAVPLPFSRSSLSR